MDPNQFILFGLVSELTRAAKITKVGDTKNLIATQGTLHQYMREFTLGDALPNEMEHFTQCKKKNKEWGRRTIECGRSPRVICMNIVWDDQNPDSILSFMNLIPNHFQLSSLFDLKDKK
jgi:hypothetical protein